MANTLKILAQANPNAATPTDAYTVPALTSTVVSRILVCNRSAVPTQFRVSLAVAGAGADNKQYIAYDTPIGGNETVVVPGVTMATTDVLRVYATLATLSFNVFGTEVT